LPTFKSRRVTGLWFRHVPGGKDVLRRPPQATDGRWQRGQVVSAVYLADTPATALSEWYRWLAESEIPPGETLPRDIWSIDLDVDVADLSTPERLAEWNLPLPAPDRRAWKKFQEVGERVWRDGWPGLVAPSAARPEGLVICLFWREPTMRGARPVPPPERWDDLPPPPRGMRT
jgi:RES domain-containing protein